jgi:hypothetical protein
MWFGSVPLVADAEGEHVRRRRRLVNGKAEVREDRTRPPARHGAGPRELQQGRSVEARRHDAEAPVQGDHAEQLRRRAAGGEDGVGHLRLVPAEPPRMARFEQLHDLAGRPGVDPAQTPSPIFSPQESPHRSSSVARSKHSAAGKDKAIGS